MAEPGNRKYEWHATVLVCWLVAGIAALSALGIGPTPTATASGANLVIHLGILALIAVALARLPILLEGRAALRGFTLFSLTLGAAACVFVLLGAIGGA